MVNYANGKIYRIVCDTTGLCYIGSTCEPLLSRRLSGHTGKYRDWIKDSSNGYVTSFKIFENDNYHIELIELYPCTCIDELTTCEGFHQRNEDCVNRRIAGRNDKQYAIDNADKIADYKKQWQTNNADKIKETKKQYYINNADKIKETKKQYRIENADKIKAYKKQYYLSHKNQV